MAEPDLTATILRQIRDEIVTTRTELRGELHELRSELKTELRELKSELELTNARLEVVEHTVRDAAAQITVLTGYVRTKQDVAIEDLRERVSKLEAKTGG
jgi:hypothetical protein